eukprot:6288229-Prymnesium_polylepis.1
MHRAAGLLHAHVPASCRGRARSQHAGRQASALKAMLIVMIVGQNGLWPMVRRKAVLKRNAALRCLWHEVLEYMTMRGSRRVPSGQP